MALSPKQYLAIREAFVDAFPSKGDLRVIADYVLSGGIASINIDVSVKQLAYDLIGEAKSQGKIPALLAAAGDLNPDNPKLQKVIEEMLPNAAAPTSTAVVVPDAVIIRQQMLFGQLLSMGFNQQDDVAYKIAKHKRIAAFLIEGAGAQCGQQLLIRRLLELTTNVDPIRIIMSHQKLWRNRALTWQRIGNAVAKDPAGYQLTKDQILDLVVQRRQNQHVVFVLEDVDDMGTAPPDPSALADWLKDFWLPLVERAQKAQQPSEYYLLLILVDYSGDIIAKGNTTAHLAQLQRVRALLAPGSTEIYDAGRPIHLNMPSVFTVEFLQEWLNLLNSSRFVPGLAILDTLTAEDLYKQTGGAPLDAYQLMCKLFGWEGATAQWWEQIPS